MEKFKFADGSFKVENNIKKSELNTYLDFFSNYIKTNNVKIADISTINLQSLLLHIMVYKPAINNQDHLSPNLDWYNEQAFKMAKYRRSPVHFENNNKDYENVDIFLDYFAEDKLIEQLNLQTVDHRNILSKLSDFSTIGYKEELYSYRPNKLSISSTILREFDSKRIFDFNAKCGDKYLASILHFSETYLGYSSPTCKHIHDSLNAELDKHYKIDHTSQYQIKYDTFYNVTTSEPSFDLVFSTVEPITTDDLSKYAKEYLLLNLVKSWQEYLIMSGYMVINGVKPEHVHFVVLLVMTYCLGVKFEGIITFNEHLNLVFYKDSKPNNTQKYYEELETKYKFKI
jgi:hypothetical protein